MFAEPEPLYVFVNRMNRICQHNLRVTRAISSAGWTAAYAEEGFRKLYVDGDANFFPLVPNQSISTGFMSFYTANSTADYGVDYDAEYYRRILSPKSPSRFSAIYAFGDQQECLRVGQKYHWDLSTVRKFSLFRDPTIDSLSRFCRVNMEIVSLMRAAYASAVINEPTRRDIWRHYWEGKGNVSIELPTGEFCRFQQWQSGEIWEYLIEGRLLLVDDSPVF